MARGASLLVAAAILVVGCGSGEAPDTPAACLAPPGEYVAALQAAPGEVRLEGTTPIGDCLVEEQGPGQLAQVGQSIVAAATRLNQRVRELSTDREAAARMALRQQTVELGYLVGVVRQAASTTSGIHEDLALRAEAAARYRPGEGGFPASFERAFGEGYAAGQESG